MMFHYYNHWQIASPISMMITWFPHVSFSPQYFSTISAILKPFCPLHPAFWPLNSSSLPPSQAPCVRLPSSNLRDQQHMIGKLEHQPIDIIWTPHVHINSRDWVFLYSTSVNQSIRFISLHPHIYIYINNIKTKYMYMYIYTRYRYTHSRCIIAYI